MNYHFLKKNFLTTIFILAGSGLFAQESDFSFEDKLNDANLLMEEKRYPVALPIWLEILQTDSNNSNWNYKVGLCYLNSVNERAKSLKYFEKAVLRTAKNYNPFSPEEIKAPLDAYYYLAKSCHLNNQIDKAVENFNKFIEIAGKKHYLAAEVERNIEMCANARELLQKPVEVKIKNIGATISSPAPEYGAIVSLDERALYFTSRRLWKDSSNSNMKERNDGEYFEDIYVSFKSADGKWLEPELLNFNRPDDHEATVSLSADGQTLFLYRDDDGNGNLYQSTLVDTVWSTPVPMGSNINSKSHETHLTATMDGKTLYFVSNRKGGLGEKDIYKCTKLPNGQWSLAQNLGPQINTPFDEDGPFIHPDGKTLFFSSKGHKSLGGFDIFISTLKEDGSWTPPENIGYPINTTDDDIFFVLSPDGKRAYYSSFRNEGMGSKDIYLIEQPGAMEHSLTLIKGTIKVPEGSKMPDDIDIVVTNNETGEFITSIKPLKRNGSFVFVIPPGKNYNISYLSKNVEFYNENVYVPINSEYKEINKTLEINPLMLGSPDAVKVDVVNPDDKPLRQWQMRSLVPGYKIPDSLFVQYINESGMVIYEELLPKSGFFSYYELEKTQSYIFTLKSKDNTLCRQGEIVLMGGDSTRKFLPDAACVFKEESRPEGIVRFKKLGMEAPEKLKMQFLDEKGMVIFETESDKTKGFAFHRLPSDSAYSIKMNGISPSSCNEMEIVIPDEMGKKLVLTADENCVFRVREQKPRFDYSLLGKEKATGLSVQYIDDKGNVLYEGKIDEKGEFPYFHLPMEKDILVKLNNNDQKICDQTEMTIPAPDGSLYTLLADENCIFRVAEKKSKFVYQQLNKDNPGGLKVQILDEQGNILIEETLNEKGEFAYHKLPPDKNFSIRLLPHDGQQFVNAEIVIPSVGKKFYTFKPDSTGIFRLQPEKESVLTAQRENSGQKPESAKVLEKPPFKEAVKELPLAEKKEKNGSGPETANAPVERILYFEYNSAVISDQHKKELDEIVNALLSATSLKAEISGHTDANGTEDYNKNLSRQRVNSAISYIISKGIARSRITHFSFGEDKPVAPNIHPDGSDNPDGRQKNRRVEIRIAG